MRWSMIALTLPLLTAADDAPPAAGDPAAWVDRQVQARQLRPGEQRFDEIGWAADIRDALKVAKQTRRPVFLFTHDGRMNVGRC